MTTDTQEIVNPSPEDIVLFTEAAKVRFRTIANLAGVIAARGYSFQDEWTQLDTLMLASTEFNRIDWADGR